MIMPDPDLAKISRSSKIRINISEKERSTVHIKMNVHKEGIEYTCMLRGRSSEGSALSA